MAFKCYISGQLTDPPDGDLSLTTSIKRDKKFSGIVINQETTLVWYQNNDLAPGTVSAYSLIKTQFDLSICGELPILIYDEVSATETNLVHIGVIKLPQVQFQEQPISLSTKVQDNSWYSYIYNNKDLKVDFRAIQTKNKINTTALDFYTVDLFNGVTGQFGSAFGIYYKGYLLTDIFEFIIRVISDEKIGFQSDYLSTLTYPLMLFKGQSLLNPFTIFPAAPEPVFEVSFQEVFTEINKLKNIYFYIDTTDPENPVLRLEKTEDTFGVTPIYAFENPLNVLTRVDVTNLYTQVKVGSEVLTDGQNPWYTMNEAISYYGFKQEFFFPLGQCNSQEIGNLDLVNSWVLSNNVIQDILVGGATIYNDDYILIEVDGVDTGLLTANAYPWDFFGQATPPFFYNLGLNNFQKMQRHSDKFETAFGNFLGIGGLGFRALLGDNPTQDIIFSNSGFSVNYVPPPPGVTRVAEFVNETTDGGYDGSNNYNNVTFEYVVPVDGDYSFSEKLHLETAGYDGINYYTVTVTIIQYDAALVVKSGVAISTIINSNGFSFAEGTLVANCVAGDIVKASYTLAYNYQPGTPQVVSTVVVIWDSYFECNGTPDGGISITSGNTSIKKLLHEFDYNIDQSDWNTIKANPTGFVTLLKDGVTRIAWIEDMMHNDQTGLTQVILRSQNNATA